MSNKMENSEEVTTPMMVLGTDVVMIGPHDFPEDFENMKHPDDYSTMDIPMDVIELVYLIRQRPHPNQKKYTVNTPYAAIRVDPGLNLKLFHSKLQTCLSAMPARS